MKVGGREGGFIYVPHQPNYSLEAGTSQRRQLYLTSLRFTSPRLTSLYVAFTALYHPWVTNPILE
jgi:hypothetical protein